MKPINLIVVFFFLLSPVFAQVTSEKEVLAKGHPIYCIDYSDDGKMVATGGGDLTLRIVSTSNWSELMRLKGLRDIPLAVCFSPDNQLVAAGGKDNQITIWNLSTQTIKLVLKGHKGQIMDIEFSPDGKEIASAGMDKNIIIWNVESGTQVRTLTGHTKGVNALCYSPSGDELVSGSADENVNIWNVKTGMLKKSIKAHTNWVRAVAYSPDGSLIASGGDDMRIQIWDAVSGEKLNTFMGHKKWVQTLAFSPDGNYILSGGHDNIIMLTDLKSGKVVFRSKKLSNFILSVDFNPNGDTFASSELYSPELQVWNSRTLGIKPLQKSVAQKMSQNSGMIPKISWVSPANGSNVNSATVKIQASIFSESSLRNIQVYLNGKLFASKDRSELMLETAESTSTNYSESVVLSEGKNTLMIKAINIVGEGISEQISINYTQTASKLVTWLNPSLSPVETNNPDYELRGLIGSSKGEQTIYVLVNNITQTTLKLPASGGMVSQVIHLNSGANNVKFLIQNPEITKESEACIIKLTQATKPIITWSLPSKDSTSYISSSRILAAVVSQVPLNQIDIKVNGIVVQSNKQMQESQYIVDQQIQLIDGQNIVEIVAVNSSGTTLSIPRIITYSKPVVSNISWIWPAGATTVYSSVLEVNTCIQTQSKVTRVVVYNNNIPVLTDDNITAFNSEGECKVVFKKPIVLTPGINNIQVTAQTLSEVIKTDPIAITYVLATPAVVSWINPVEGPATSSESAFNLKACISSNTPLQELTIYCNNQVVNTIINPVKNSEGCDFELQQTIPLQKGINTVMVKTKNKVGENYSQPVVIEQKSINPYRFALIFGNEDYSSFQAELNSESNVDFAVNDARSFKTVCETVLGIAPENIVYLENARYIEMRKALKKINGIIQVTNGKAEVFAFYAGHGFPDEKTKDPYLVPVDGSGNDLEFSAIKLTYFYDQLTEFQAERVTVFIDACFSGGARNQGLVAARGVKVVPKETSAAVKKNLVVFTASSGDQSSLPYKDYKHGMFTYFLINKLEESKGDITYGELSDYVSEQVGIKSFLINSKKQEPQTNVSPEIINSWKNWKFK